MKRGSTPDWVEIWNTAPDPVNLGGWHLTDRATKLTKWTFPATNLASGGFLVVFASGKDRAVAGAPLHTNFKLSSAGEYLGLVEPDGQTISHQVLAGVSAPGLRRFLRHPVERPGGDLGGRLLYPTDPRGDQLHGLPRAGSGP